MDVFATDTWLSMMCGLLWSGVAGPDGDVSALVCCLWRCVAVRRARDGDAVPFRGGGV